MPIDGTTLVIVPVLGRPHRVVPLIESLKAATPEPHRLVFVATDSDQRELDAIDAAGAERFTLSGNALGDYQMKINYAYRHSTEPFLFTGADDLDFHPFWLARALEAMADPKVGVVGTNDLGSPRVMAGVHSTHSLVRRAYVDEFGTIDESRKVMCELYAHEFCDDEFVQTAMSRGAFVHAHDSLVEHMHPNWKKAHSDPLYERQQRRMAQGRKVYRRREHLWGGNPCQM